MAPDTKTGGNSELVTVLDDSPSPVPGVSETPAHLTVLSGPEIGRVFLLREREITVGRGPENGVRLNHSSVSRVHARIRRLPGGDYEIEDLGSRNHTTVAGQPIHGRCLLRAGDRLEFGSRMVLQFSITDQTARRLREAEKFETIGLLAASVNHDFNNVLTVMTCGLAYLAELDGKTAVSAPEIQECLDDMRVATKTAASLTSRLGMLMRRGEHAVHEHVNVSEVADEVVVLMTRILPKAIQIDSAIEPGLVVDGYRAWIHQLLMNPCINARDAMPDGGRLRIEARQARPDEVAAHRELGTGPHVLFTISDTGMGMTPEVAARAFDPLFTTKGAGSGTGLGLATVARVAREHGGTVALSSERGRGTSIHCWLPSVTVEHTQAQRPTLSPKEIPVTVPPAHSPLVLLVDDDPAIVRSIARVVTRAGYVIAEAANGLEALERFRQLPRPNLVLLDVDMPVMNGKACFEKLRLLDPTVPVIFVSGYADSELQEAMRSRGARAFLSKPLDHGQLTQAIEHALRPPEIALSSD